MKQSFSWEAKSNSVKKPAFYGTRRFITVFITARHSPELDESSLHFTFFS
jgi:hypothetical protein